LQGGDIYQGKKTWLFLKSQNSNFTHHQELFQLSDPSEKAKKVIDYWISIGLDQDCLRLIQTYNQHALEDLEILKKEGLDCAILEELLDYLGNRNS
jgi:geranylgeranyl pyrophosphate synthase